MLYLGIESGSDIILKKITKGATSETIIRACRKAIETGFTLSCIIILGLGGKNLHQGTHPKAQHVLLTLHHHIILAR